jgi:L-rhamnose mutarotase
MIAFSLKTVLYENSSYLTDFVKEIQRMKIRYCLALDLKNDIDLIKEYERFHKPEHTWPEITESIQKSGIIDMEIYRTGNRLFMIMEVDETFDFSQKAEMDSANPKVQEWESLMWKFQQPLPWAKEGEKWINMARIFKL